MSFQVGKSASTYLLCSSNLTLEMRKSISENTLKSVDPGMIWVNNYKLI